MATEHKNCEDEYNSSSDEDYDPSKDVDFDPQDEIDDTEGVEEDIEEDVEQLQEVASNEKKSEKCVNSTSSSGSVDVDAIFAALTGQDPSTDGKESSSISQLEEKVYPKSVPSVSTELPEPRKVYPKKSETTELSTGSANVAGKKRVGLLDAAKTLSKRSKVSVLERSDRDWKDFTMQNNLKEDLESHNRGKGGYLNKMEFLNRTDNRQFEKERAFRATARKDTGS